jgi:hypothetical protein
MAERSSGFNAATAVIFVNFPSAGRDSLDVNIKI